MQTPSKEPRSEKMPKSVFSNFVPNTEEASAESHDTLSQQATEKPGCSLDEPHNPGALQDQIDFAVARGFVYAFLARAYETPARKAWKWLCKPETKRTLRKAARTLANSDTHPVVAAVNNIVAELQLKAFDTAASSYVTAFGHTVRGDCPMNEIEYGDIKADALFQPHRLADLAAFYSAFGLQMTDDGTERQDHICIELEFMSVLAMKEAYALENQLDAEQLALGRDAQKKFLHEHLARWTPAFCRRLAVLAAGTPFEQTAQFTQAFIKFECDRFGIVPGSEDLMLRPVDESAERLCESCGINNLPPGALSSL